MAINPQEIKFALLCGGKSGEREISMASGKGAQVALESAGFPVQVLDPSRREDLVALVEGDFDVAFICLHGRYGEDGTVQGFLELLGIPYIGSGVWSSATAIDKAKAKVFYQHNGIPTPVAQVLRKGQSVTGQELVAKVGNRCVVKPANEGSALGVFIVESPEAVEDALEKVFEIDTEVLVETYVKGTEFTVSVLGNDNPEAMPVIQIVPSHEFYDFESKYAPGGSQHLCPAPLSEEDTKRAQELAVAAHKVLGCRGVSRTDMIKDEEGNFWVLETNTVPGMTETSLLPDAGRAAGMSFSQLCQRLVELALEQ